MNYKPSLHVLTTVWCPCTTEMVQWATPSVDQLENIVYQSETTCLQCGHTVSHALLEISSHQPIGSASSQHQRTGICRCNVTPHSLVPKSAIPCAAIICLLNCRIDPVSFSAGKSSLVPTPPYSVDSTSVLFPEALPGTMAASIPTLSPQPSSVRIGPFWNALWPIAASS